MKYIGLCFSIVMLITACAPVATVEPSATAIVIAPTAPEPTFTPFADTPTSQPVIPTAAFATETFQESDQTFPTTTAGVSAEALAYLETALDIMQANALNRNLVRWDQINTAALRLASSAQTPADTYPAIQLALRSLEDGHSYLIPAGEVQSLQLGELDDQNEPVSTQLLADASIVLLKIPGFLGSEEAVGTYAVDLQRLIAEMDSSQPCGWVVDLRENQGGAMWPMLAGIGPVLGEGLAGSFLYPDAIQKFWYYTASKALLDDEIQVDVMDEIYYQLQEDRPLAAVLVGPNTASSGEALAVAFHNRENARSFGQETTGLTTATERFDLRDGAWLMLAVAVYTDRLGNVFNRPYSPDTFVPVDAPGEDPTLIAAVNWLLAQPACEGR